MNRNTYSPYDDSPGLVKTIAVMTLINGIVNIFWGLILTGTVVIPTFGLALLCLPLILITLMPTILGVFESIYATKLLTNPPQPIQPSTTIAILEILCVLFGNVLSMVVGILSLVFYNDPQVKEYFANLNGIPYPVAPDAPVPPASPTTEIAPAIETESPADVAPKPRKRKVAAADKTKVDPKPDKPKRKPKSGSSSS